MILTCFTVLCLFIYFHFNICVMEVQCGLTVLVAYPLSSSDSTNEWILWSVSPPRTHALSSTFLPAFRTSHSLLPSLLFTPPCFRIPFHSSLRISSFLFSSLFLSLSLLFSSLFFSSLFFFSPYLFFSSLLSSSPLSSPHKQPTQGP